MLLKVTSTRMTSYISTTLHYFFVGYGMLLHLRWLPFTLSMERITQMVSYQIIVATPRSGEFSSTGILDCRYHALAGFEVKEGLWSGKRVVTEIRKVFPFLVFPSLSFILLESNKDI